MRSDFHFMKELASHTHVDAPSRYNRLRQFVTDIDQYVDIKFEEERTMDNFRIPLVIEDTVYNDIWKSISIEYDSTSIVMFRFIGVFVWVLNVSEKDRFQMLH